MRILIFAFSMMVSVLAAYGRSTDGAYYLLTPDLATNIANAVCATEREDYDASNKWYDATFEPGIDPITGEPWKYPTNTSILASSKASQRSPCSAENKLCRDALIAYEAYKRENPTRRDDGTNTEYRIGGGYVLVNDEQVECTGIEFDVPATRDSARDSFYIYAEYNIASNTARLVKGSVLPDCTFSKEYAVTPIYFFEGGKRKILDCTTIPTAISYK